MQISNKCDFVFRFQIRYWLSELRAPSGGRPQPTFYHGARVGPIWAPCGPHMGCKYGPYMGLSTGSMWAPANIDIWAPYGLYPGSMGSMWAWAENGQFMWVPCVFHNVGPI